MRVPQEIIDSIIQLSEDDPATLCNLCLVSTSFLSKAQRVLYHKIRISGYCRDEHSVWFIDLVQAIILLETIVNNNQALAKLIRKLHLHTHHYDSSYATLLHQGLQLMDNLESLTGMIPDFVLSEGCTFHLKYFDYDETWYDDEGCQQAIRFLASQSSLKSFYMWGFSEPTRPFPENILPNLEAFGGNCHTIARILPDRPSVTTLSWSPVWGEDICTLPRILVSPLSNIRVLSLGGYHPRPDLRLFLPYLRSLRVLRIYGESPKLALCDELALIPDLPALRVFIWTAGVFSSFKWSCFEKTHTQYTLVDMLFSKTTLLSKVYIHTSRSELGIVLSPQSGVDSQHYLCWKRGVIEPSVVDRWDAVEAHSVMSWYSPETP